DDLPVFAAYRETPVTDPPDGTVLVPDAIFQVVIRALGQFRQGLGHGRPIFFQDILKPLFWIFVDRLARPSPNLLIGGADVKQLFAGRRGDPKNLANVFRQLTETQFTFA